MDIDHSSMQGNGRAIHTEGGEFGRTAGRLRAQVEPLLPYFGNPASDEAAQIFRRGKDGHPGFDGAYEDMSTALRNLRESYEVIGSAVVAMSKNVRGAEWASMADKNGVLKDLLEFARREDDEVGVPTTPVERDR
ncbi:hypothetical protein [Nonomuraea sp. NPDC050643]|uniref:hypothetical protein n=1 Tax=Nonomuraea sp. NPDC050643 TaxID=3155660 RepID=UPI0033F2F33C